jgi:glycosyltransferase involved in cell wall biosynthesis
MLVLVGAGELEADVVDEATRLGIDHRVRMVGYQTNVADWLALATVWIFPTERENFSIALLEAMAAGCAILATECPGNDEILEDESNALTFAVGDISGAARKLRRLLDDARLRDRLGQRSQATAKENTAQEMVALYVQAYAAPATTPL